MPSAEAAEPPEGCSSSAVRPPGRVHLGAAGGWLQCAPTALQSRHQTGEWQQDLSPALRATMKKKTRLRKSAFQLLEEKVKANGHLPCTHSGGNCLEHIYKGHSTF